MPDLTPYIARRPLQRTGPGGGGGGGTVGLPRVPDVSNIYRATGQIGEELGQLAGTLATVARQRQRAQDTATLTAAEASIDEELAARRDEMMADQSHDPWTYRETLSGYRDQLIEQRSATLPGRLQPLLRASIMKSTQAQIINVGAEGTKRGIARAIQSFDLRQDQLTRQWLTETDPMQRLEIERAQRDLTASYVDSGIISEIDGLTRLKTIGETATLQREALAIRLDPDAALARYLQGPAANPTIPPAELPKLIDTAQTEAREGRAVRREARLEAKDLEEARIETNARQFLIDIATNKPGVRRAIVQAGARGDLKDTQLRSLLGDYEREQTRRTEGVPSDPTLLLSMTYQANQVDSPLTDEAIYETRGLNTTDKVTLLEKNRARRDAREGKALSALKDEHAQAEQLIRVSLGIPTIWDKLDQGTQRAYASAFNDLTEASRLYPTIGDPQKKERPLIAARRIVNTYAKVLGNTSRVQSDEFARALTYKGPEGLPDAKALLENKDTLTPEAYELQIELLRKYREAKDQETFFRTSEEESR